MRANRPRQQVSADQVAAADSSAAPALARRDQAAGALLTKLDAEAAAADAEAAAQDTHAAAAADTAELADKEHGKALAAAAAATERHRGATAAIAAAAVRLAAAIDELVVPDGTLASEIEGILADALTAHTRAAREVGDAKQTEADLAQQVLDVGTKLGASEQALAAARQRAHEARTALLSETRVGDRIGALPVIVEAAGSEAGAGDDQPLNSGQLDEAADALLGVLATNIGAHTDSLDVLRAAQNEDARIRDALGDGGLLPPRAEVERALDVLDAAGVGAHPGWRYLHEAAPAHQRAELIGAHPELADGIVLIDPAQVAAARHALDAAALLPAAAVAVGVGATLLTFTAGEEPGPEAPFVIEPTPAMYDQDAAQARQDQLRTQMAGRGKQMGLFEGQLDQTRTAHSELSVWRRENPPGHLGSLRAEAERLGAQQDTEQQAVTTRRDELSALDRAKGAAVQRVEAAVLAERGASDRRHALQVLDGHVQEGAAAASVQAKAAADQARAQDSAAAALTRRTAATTSQQVHTRGAEQARAQAARHRAACADVTSTSGARAGALGAQSLPQLRTAAEAAHQAYLAVAADNDLRGQADRAADQARRARQTLDLRDPRHVAEAERLLATAAGADTTGWEVAMRNARTNQAGLTGTTTRLNRGVGKLEQAVMNAEPTDTGRKSWITLPERWRPTSAAHGRALQGEAQEASRAAQGLVEEATRQRERLVRQREAAADVAQGLREALLPLTTLQIAADKSTATDPSRYFGDPARDSELAVTLLRTTREQEEQARRELDAAIAELRAFANQSRFGSMTNPVRASILESPAALLGTQAADWSAALQARLATLSVDLDNASRHRKTIVDRLSALVDQCLHTLRQAGRLSQLPADLGDWGGRKFLRIAFSETDLSAITVRVADVVDQVAASYATRSAGARGTSPVRDGVALLLEAVHAAVPKGFTVDVLKPDSVLRDERVGIEEMSEVFSGGQELTAAIVLYCTLAALKANERGQMRAQHSGVLFLDNPIGRASASYLLDLQQSVARSLGVQLVYTTGLYDDRVLAAFPLWVRMRNDADLRAGLKHIRVADVVRRQLPDPFTDAELAASGGAGDTSSPGTVTAARVYQRPAAPGGGTQPAAAP